MYAVTISLIVTACVFVGGLIGVLLHPRLPQSHLTRETQDVVKLGIGMLSVLASLVLGLLIATAKGFRCHGPRCPQLRCRHHRAGRDATRLWGGRGNTD